MFKNCKGEDGEGREHCYCSGCFPWRKWLQLCCVAEGEVKLPAVM